MKAITLTQPWATLAARSLKGIETRSWKTEYRGPIAIHAAKTFPINARTYCYMQPFRELLLEHSAIKLMGFTPTRCVVEGLPLGAVLAVAYLRDIVPIESEPEIHQYGASWFVKVPPDEPELSLGDYSPGRWAWILHDVKTLPEPIPAKGALGLWEWTEPQSIKELMRNERN